MANVRRNSAEKAQHELTVLLGGLLFVMGIGILTVLMLSL